ncbi:endolytic transglycosylase MltG [Methylocystis sp. IM3]|uniref:endolytic transglycosylase MltG n=1 Tax=Methylocystis sp. IM3 TaxID=3136722 RepID=UPI00405355E3
MTMMSDETGDKPTPEDDTAQAKGREASSGSAPPAEPGAGGAGAPETPSAAPPASPAPIAGPEETPEAKPVEAAASEKAASQAAAEAPKPETGPADSAAETGPAEPIPASPEPLEPKSAEPAPAQPALSKPAAPSEREGEKTGGSIFSRRATLQAARQTLQPEAPPAPPRKKKKRRDGTLSVMSGFLSFMLVALVAGVFGVIAVLHKLKEPGPLAADKIVYLPPRSDVPEMLAQLQREGVIDSPSLMNFAVLVEGARGKLKPGEYVFKKQASLRDVIDALVAGRQLMHTLTIPEGLTSEQILERLRDSDLLAGDILEAPKEGALLPETYKFPRGFPRSKLIVKMQEDQRKLVDQIWAKRAKDLPLRSPYELVILASIVEKETGKAEERPRVAAVFTNRLRKGMRLQSDPTIVYGLVGGKATLGRGIMRSEIEKWTPYNTYAIDGLPSGPIANPGKAALEAVANPANTRDLYFVADGTGGHVFAESLDQHSRNVQNWRRIEQEQKAKAGEGIDQSAPAAVPPPAPPKSDKPDKRTQAPIGRMIALGARHEDYPASREMAADDGPTHRIGKFSPAGAAFFLGGYEDPTADATPRPARLRVARPYFTEPVAQPKGPANGFDPTLLAARAAPEGEGEEEGALGPDMLARESADGKALPDGPGDIALYPVSPARRAELKARAARLGLATGSDDAPTDALVDRTAPEETPVPAPARVADGAAPLALAPAPQRARPRAFDASEGTPLDPLRDKSWDLTSAKTVPSAASIR